MEENIRNITVEQLGSIIGLFASSMDDYLYVYDFKQDYYQISPRAAERFLLPSDCFRDVAEEHRRFVYPEDVEKLLTELEQLALGEKTFHNMHYRWLGRDREPIWINCRGRVLNDPDETPRFLVGCINEIGAKQKADNVSGLLGESSFAAYYGSFQGRIPEGFLLRIGIDDFKDINENQGMEYGDFILRKTAECIAANILPGQRLFRIVADEFMVADFLGGSEAEAEELYQKICGDIFSFIEKNQYKSVYTVSGGVLKSGTGDASFGTAMKLSEFALSEAKRSGKNSCRVFHQDAYEVYLRKKELTRILHHAVNHQFCGFEVYYQPLVETESAELSGAEALLRFWTPKEELISPAEFIPILEESGLIIPVGRWILRQALNTCREFQQYLPEFRINVNLSYVQVKKSGVLHDIIAAVEENGVSPESVCVELTESGYLEENPHFIQVWRGLQEYGILLALDDFGTGYSNLHCLCDLKPAFIKIDRSFMLKALNREYEYRLLVHMIEMAHSLELDVCAEGIESEAELQKARKTGPDYIQGFLFGKPCSREQFFRQFFRER